MLPKTSRIFHEACDRLEETFPDLGHLELHLDERAGEDNGAGSDRQFAYCRDGEPIQIAFASKVEQLPVSRIRGLMRHEIGHALDYRYGKAELERQLQVKLPSGVERRADAIAEAVWNEPIVYDGRDIQAVGVDGAHPRPRHLARNARRFDPEQIRLGTKHEMEHTDDPVCARQIAEDHLREIPDYYTRLEKLEDRFKQGLPPNPVSPRMAERERQLREMLAASAPEPLRRFAAEVLEISSQPGVEHFGHKAFIASVWDEARASGAVAGQMPLSEFKRYLVEANTAGLLRLSRADLVGAMDPEMVHRSETVHLTATFHFIEGP